MTEVDAQWVPEPSDPTGPDRAALIEDLPDAVLVMDHQARLLWGNRAAEDLFGRSLEESVGLDCITLVHPSDLEMAVVSLAGMQSERVGQPLELRVSTPEGWRRMEMVGHSRADDIILVFRDLTDRHRWEVASDNLDVLRTVLQHISTVVMVIEPDGRVRSSSAALTRLLGLDQLEVEGRHLSGLVSSDDRVAVGRAIREALDAPVGASVAVDVGARRADDSFLPVTFSLVNLVDDPTVGGLVMTVHDISRSSAAEAALLETNAVLSATLESVADGIVATDGVGIRTCNQQFFEIWEVPEESPARSDIYALTDHIRSMVEDPDALVAGIAAIDADLAATSEDIIEFLDGRVIERRSRPRLIDGRAAGRVWSFRDVTATRRLQEELAHQAVHDPLTGLANQVLFAQRLEASVAGAGEGAEVAAVFIDLDNFKAVNDTLGHSSGDRLLVEMAERLRSSVRPADTVARLGGDEFALLLVGLDGEEAAITVARRLIENVSRPIDLLAETVVVGASIGVAVTDRPVEPDSLLRSADLAMYHAKQSGRNQFRLYTSDMAHTSGGRGNADARLRGAAARGELVIHYQPVVDPARDDAIVGLEALVRWNHPDRGLVMPGDFIPYAEASGLIDEIGLHVLEEACRTAAGWQGYGPDAPLVSVNLSPHQLLDEGLPDRVGAVLAAVGLAGDRLVLEFTESSLMQDPSVVARQIRAIRRHGVHIAIDDFGTGHSSLARLQQFPINTLKIDRAFVQQVEDHTGRSLVRAIVQLAHTLNMLTVAEGVETAIQQQRLDEVGVDLAQGFLYHRPLPAEEIAELLASCRGGPGRAAAPAPLP